MIGQPTTFGKIHIGQLFFEDGRLWQRVDRARDRFGAYNARLVGDGDSYAMFSPIRRVKAVPVGAARAWRA